MAGKAKKRPIGRPMLYGNLLISLEDNQLYTPSKIASVKVDQSTDWREHQRVRLATAAYARRHMFPSEGDGMLKMKGQASVPAWFGWRWKEEIVSDGVMPVKKKKIEAAEKKATKLGRKGPGRPMKYGKFIETLNVGTLYSVEAVIVHGEKEGLFAEYDSDQSFKKNKAKVRYSMNRYCKRHLPKNADGVVEGPDAVNEPAWYGWRWQLCLPNGVNEIPAKIAQSKEIETKSRPRGKGFRRLTNFLPKRERRWTPLIAAALVSWVITGFVGMGWITERSKIEDDLKAERKRDFLKWNPQLNFSARNTIDLNALGEIIEGYYQTPILVPPAINDRTLSIDTESVSLDDLFKRNGLDWEVTENYEIEIFVSSDNP